MFFCSFSSGKLGIEALLICLFDLAFVFTYLIFFYKRIFMQRLALIFFLASELCYYLLIAQTGIVEYFSSNIF